MPVISRFCGIVIKIYLRQKEHNPPHLHAIYGDYVGLFSLEDGEMYEGDIPVKEQKIHLSLQRSALLHVENSGFLLPSTN